MTDEQPEPWAVELWRNAFDAHAQSGSLIPSKAAAITIQRAFAEREAELVGAADYLIELLERINRREVVRDLAEAKAAYAALKSREAGHG